MPSCVLYKRCLEVPGNLPYDHCPAAHLRNGDAQSVPDPFGDELFLEGRRLGTDKHRAHDLIVGLRTIQHPNRAGKRRELCMVNLFLFRRLDEVQNHEFPIPRSNTFLEKRFPLQFRSQHLASLFRTIHHLQRRTPQHSRPARHKRSPVGATWYQRTVEAGRVSAGNEAIDQLVVRFRSRSVLQVPLAVIASAERLDFFGDAEFVCRVVFPRAVLLVPMPPVADIFLQVHSPTDHGLAHLPRHAAMPFRSATVIEAQSECGGCLSEPLPETPYVSRR